MKFGLLVNKKRQDQIIKIVFKAQKNLINKFSREFTHKINELSTKIVDNFEILLNTFSFLSN